MYMILFIFASVIAFAAHPSELVLVPDEEALLSPEETALVSGISIENIALPSHPEEFKLDHIFVRGELPVDSLTYLLPFASGDEIQSEPLQRNLNFFNRNPFRKTEAIFSPGSSPQTKDLTFVVEEGRPFKMFAGSDNEGVKPTGEGRFFSGASFTSPGKTILGALKYTASYDFHRYQSWNGSFTAFLPWKHILSISGTYSLLHPDTTLPMLKNEGKSNQAVVRYTLPSLDSEKKTQDLSFGFDFKQINNILEFVIEAPEQSQIQLATVSQLALEYAAQRLDDAADLEFSAAAFGGPGDLFPHQSEEDFSRLNPGAKNLYAYANGSVKYTRRFTFGDLIASSRGQIATGTLLPSEQVSIGGATTVRGYNEGQYDADQALLSSLEWHSPSWSLFFHRKSFSDQMHLLLFTDGGYGMQYATPANNFFASVGPGLRYSIPPYLSLKLDLGFKLHEQADLVGDFYKWHFNLQGSF
jgi:hemolysin activation/secretion protein